MKLSVTEKIISYFAVSLGAILLIFATINMIEESEINFAFGIIFTLAYQVLGIITLVLERKTTKPKIGLFITLFVFNSLYILTGLTLLFIIPGVGLLFILLFGVPFAFGIVYFVNYYNQEAKLSDTLKGYQLYSFISSIDEEERRIKAYEIGLKYLEEKEYEMALKMFEKIPDYRDSKLHIFNIQEILIKREKEELMKKIDQISE